MQLSRDELLNSNSNGKFCPPAKNSNSCAHEQDVTPPPPIPRERKCTPLASAQSVSDPHPVNINTVKIVKDFQKSEKQVWIMMENNISTEVNTLTAQSVTTAANGSTSVESTDPLPHMHHQLMICDKPAHERTSETLTQQHTDTLPSLTPCQEIFAPCPRYTLSACTNAVEILSLSTEAFPLSERRSCQEAMVLDNVKDFLRDQLANTPQYEQPKSSLGQFKAFSARQSQGLGLQSPSTHVGTTVVYDKMVVIEVNASTILLHILDVSFVIILYALLLLCLRFLFYMELVASLFFLKKRCINDIDNLTLPTDVSANGDNYREDFLTESDECAPDGPRYPIRLSSIQLINTPLKNIGRSSSSEHCDVGDLVFDSERVGSSSGEIDSNPIPCEFTSGAEPVSFTSDTENVIILPQPQSFYSKFSSSEIAVSILILTQMFLVYRKLAVAMKQEQADSTESPVRGYKDQDDMFEFYEGPSVHAEQESTEHENSNGKSRCTLPCETSCQKKTVSRSQISLKKSCKADSKAKQSGTGTTNGKGHRNRTHAKQSKSSTTNRQTSRSTPRQGGNLGSSGGSGRDGDDDDKDWKRKPNQAHIPPDFDSEEGKTTPRQKTKSSANKSRKKSSHIPSTSPPVQKSIQPRPSNPPTNNITPRNRETESNSVIGCSGTRVSQQGASGDDSDSSGGGVDSDGDTTVRDMLDPPTHQAMENKHVYSPMIQTNSKTSELERGLKCGQTEHCDTNRKSSTAAARKTSNSVNIVKAREETQSTHLNSSLVVSPSKWVMKRADKISCDRGGGTSRPQATDDSSTDECESEALDCNPAIHPESNPSSSACATSIESSPLASPVLKKTHTNAGEHDAVSNTLTSGYFSQTKSQLSYRQPDHHLTSPAASELSFSYSEGEEIKRKPQSNSDSSGQTELVTGKTSKEHDHEPFPASISETCTVVSSCSKESSPHSQLVIEESVVHQKDEFVAPHSKSAGDTSEFESLTDSSLAPYLETNDKSSKAATNYDLEEAVLETNKDQLDELVTLAPPAPLNVEASTTCGKKTCHPPLSDAGIKPFTGEAGQDSTVSLVTFPIIAPSLLPGHGHGENNGEPDGTTTISSKTTSHQFRYDPPTLAEQGTQKYFPCHWPTENLASTNSDNLKSSTSESDSEGSSCSGSSRYRWSQCIPCSSPTNCKSLLY